MDLAGPHELDQLGQEAPYRREAAVEANMGKEQFLRIEIRPVRKADVADRAAGAGGTNRLHDRLRSADTLEHRIRADSFRQVLDAGHGVVTALRHDVGGAELARQ